jgi:hypothetical protein
MPKKEKILKDIEKEVVDQDKEGRELENWEKLTGEKLDETRAPAVEAMKKLRNEWKQEETEREIGESDDTTDEPSDIEEKEKAGEEPYLETGKIIKEEADEEDED